MDATGWFICALAHQLPRTPGGAAARVAESLELPRDKRPALLRSMGFVEDVSAHHLSGRTLRLSEFLQIVTRLSLSELTTKEIASFRGVFNRYAHGGQWTAKQFEQLVREFGDAALPLQDAGKLVRKWALAGQPHVDFDGLCSMFASYLKFAELDKEVEADWAQVVAQNADGVLTAADVSRVFGIPRLAAEDAIWEADVADQGFLSFADFVHELTTVWSPDGAASTLAGTSAAGVAV